LKLSVKALSDDHDFELELTLLAGAQGLDRGIEHDRVQKPGLAMAGLVTAIRAHCVQILGRTEIRYLESLDAAGQRVAARLLYDSEIACVVVTTSLLPPKIFFELADSQRVPLFRTTLPSGHFINHVHDFLDEHLSEETTLHGVLVDVFGVGVLLMGASGIGKSECALDLILRGHRLVADDAVTVKMYRQQLIGLGSPLTRLHMEVRGLGIINVRDLFGAAAVRERKRIELVVEMHEHVNGTYDRLGIDDLHENILGVNISKVIVPVRPGRNMTSIVEVAARNHLLKMQGHNSARDFKEALERRLAAVEGESE
jgi:HPr kinase/phosphorylase